MAEHWENKADVVEVEDTMTSICDIDVMKAVYKIISKAIKG